MAIICARLSSSFDIACRDIQALLRVLAGGIRGEGDRLVTEGVPESCCTVGCDRNRMPLLSKASNVVQNVFFLYDVIYRLYSNWPFDSCRNQLYQTCRAYTRAMYL